MDRPAGEVKAKVNFAERLHQVEKRIAEACHRSGRKREDITIISVTKYVSAETAQQVVRTGQKHIGENRWQDAKAKWELIGSQAVWHFIGHLQTNKTKQVVGKFDYIHSLDRLSLAEEIERQASARELAVNCFIQLNVSGEKSKYGLPPDDLLPFVREIGNYPHLRIFGLMAMAPHEEDPEKTRPVFRRLRELRDQLNESGIFSYSVPHLSMGMSNDFAVAVEEGATWLRLGSILVGSENGHIG